MAELTVKDFGAEYEKLGKDPDKESIKNLLSNIGSLEDYDAEALDKLSRLMESLGADMPKNMGDSLTEKITYQRKVLEVKDAFTQEEPLRNFDTMVQTRTALGKMSLTELAQLRQDNSENKIFGPYTQLDTQFFRSNIGRAVENNFGRLVDEWMQQNQGQPLDTKTAKMISNVLPVSSRADPEILGQIKAVLATAQDNPNTSTLENKDTPQPAQEAPAQEAPAQETPAQEEPAQEQPAQEQPAQEEPAPKKPVQEQPAPTSEPEEEQPEPEKDKASKYDEMTSYDLFMTRMTLADELSQAIQNGEDEKSEKVKKLQAEIKGIENYAAEQMKGFQIDEDNAPVAKDYIAILTAANPNYDYEEQLLEEKLRKYDKKYGLDGDLPSAEEVHANEDKWAELTKKSQYYISAELKKDAGIQALRQSDPKTLEETLTTLRALALSELSLEKPDSDAEKAMQRYHQKMEELSAQYLTTVNTELQSILASQEKSNIWLDAYLKDNKMTKQQWEEALKNPEKKEAMQTGFRNYVVSNVYITANGVFTERNAIFASRLARKTGMDKTPQRAAAQKRTFAQKHPKFANFIKEGIRNTAWTLGLLAGVGAAGLTARSGWKLVGAVKTSWNNYKQQADGKTSAGGFFMYMAQNKEEAHNLLKQTAMFLTSAAFTGVMAYTNTLTFGALGAVTGLGAAAVQAGAGAAAQATILGVTKLQAMGALTAVTSAGSYLFARHKLAPKKKELMALLQKYAPEQEPAKGLFGKILSKDPAKKMYSKITGAFKDLDDEAKVAKMLQEYAPNMSAEDKAKVVELAKDVQNIKAASYGAAAGVVMGAAMAESSEIMSAVRGHAAENTNVPQTPTQEQTTPTQAEDLTSGLSSETHALSADQLKEGTDLYQATQIGPTVIYKKLIEMGVMTQDQADKIMSDEGRSYIPSRVLRIHLQDDIKFTPEQEKELNDFIHDKETFNQRCEEENIKAGIYNHGNGGNAHSTIPQGNGGHGHTGTVPQHNQTVDDGTTITKKDQTDPTTTPPEEEKKQYQEAKVRVEGKIKNHTGATAFLYKKHEHSIELDYNKVAANLGKKVEELTERDKLNAQANVYAKTYVMEHKGIKAENLSTTDYSTTGRIVDEHGVEHKIKVKNSYDSNSNVQTYSRSVETENGTEKATVRTIHHADGSKTSFSKFSNTYVEDATVGAADGGKDQLLAKVTDNQGNSRTFYVDGGSKDHDVYEVVQEKGKEPVVRKSNYTVSEVKSLIKHRDERLAMPLRNGNER